MDIEGGEYTTILRASDETLNKFRIIIIEIHDIEAWAQRNFFTIVEVFFQKLLLNFHVVHNHPNNCCGIVNIGGFLAPRVFELTLLRKDRASSDGFCNVFPHPLDKPNLIDIENLTLPANWFKKRSKIPDNDLDYFLNDVSGIIHVGANVGQERSLYDDLDLSVIWIEPIPDVYEKLKFNINNYKNQFAYNYLLTDLDDVEYDFKIANNGGESSSIFQMGSHKEIWPEIGFSSSSKMKSKTLLSFVNINKLNMEYYQGLILDTQGSELLVLRGSGDLLNNFKYIKIEVADFESYIGGPRPEEVESYLDQFGFKEARRETMVQKEGLGSYYNILYKK
jgi:FkbM family methyltransferase